MTNFTVKVRPDEDNFGTNKVEVFLDTDPKQELMIHTDRGDDVDGWDEEPRPEDTALYYAVERIAQLEQERDSLQRLANCRADQRDALASHTDDLAIDRFADAMKAKMALSREKGRDGWDDPELCSAPYLAGLLVGHLDKTNAGNFEDIGNLVMMLHQRGESPDALTSAVARRDLIKQAEALEAISHRNYYQDSGTDFRYSVDTEAKRLRHQAKGVDQ